jgi:hypothetical protein
VSDRDYIRRDRDVIVTRNRWSRRSLTTTVTCIETSSDIVDQRRFVSDHCQLMKKDDVESENADTMAVTGSEHMNLSHRNRPSTVHLT